MLKENTQRGVNKLRHAQQLAKLDQAKRDLSRTNKKRRAQGKTPKTLDYEELSESSSAATMPGETFEDGLWSAPKKPSTVVHSEDGFSSDDDEDANEPAAPVESAASDPDPADEDEDARLDDAMSVAQADEADNEQEDDDEDPIESFSDEEDPRTKEVATNRDTNMSVYDDIDLGGGADDKYDVVVDQPSSAPSTSRVQADRHPSPSSPQQPPPSLSRQEAHPARRSKSPARVVSMHPAIAAEFSRPGWARLILGVTVYHAAVDAFDLAFALDQIAHTDSEETASYLASRAKTKGLGVDILAGEHTSPRISEENNVLRKLAAVGHDLDLCRPALQRFHSAHKIKWTCDDDPPNATGEYWTDVQDTLVDIVHEHRIPVEELATEEWAAEQGTAVSWYILAVAQSLWQTRSDGRSPAYVALLKGFRMDGNAKNSDVFVPIPHRSTAIDGTRQLRQALNFLQPRMNVDDFDNLVGSFDTQVRAGRTQSSQAFAQAPSPPRPTFAMRCQRSIHHSTEDWDMEPVEHTNKEVPIPKRRREQAAQWEWSPPPHASSQLVDTLPPVHNPAGAAPHPIFGSSSLAAPVRTCRPATPRSVRWGDEVEEPEAEDDNFYIQSTPSWEGRGHAPSAIGGASQVSHRPSPPSARRYSPLRPQSPSFVPVSRARLPPPSATAPRGRGWVDPSSAPKIPVSMRGGFDPDAEPM